MMETKIYCAFDSLNPAINKTTGQEEHACGKYNTIWCLKCISNYDGDRIKEYMQTHDRVE